jgi:hypothetical protein
MVGLHRHLVELGFPCVCGRCRGWPSVLKTSQSGDALGPPQGLKNRLAEFSRSIVSDPHVVRCMASTTLHTHPRRCSEARRVDYGDSLGDCYHEGHGDGDG